MSKKLALCVGLNYPGTSAALAGCINDMNDWATLLNARGYEVGFIPEPSKAELVAALTAMIARARYRDRVVFTFSGHGTWMPDANGDEADGRDEALVCADYTRGGLLTDDELHQIFGQARFGVRRLIVSDSCHSGTVSRMVPVQKTFRPPGAFSPLVSRKVRFLPPAEFLEPGSPRYQAAVQVQSSKATSVPRAGTALLSGCADFEYSYDASFNGRPNGALTRAAIDTLYSGGVDDPATITLKEWHKRIRLRLPSAAYPQTPQLTASSTQRSWSFL